MTLIAICFACITHPFSSQWTLLDAEDAGCARGRTREHNAQLEHRR
eukprot:CAMPEP_0173395866 /NCGR_PEP_ID=MMETSP1356-20130122/33647_1 /TAXON_ID=77927 ORGANISM="Hemiselmis virescens, Strain PCC157" /NCGR_SAMPLE_ID=MMETSP1356 /ASSEMBLY_ACC=CAM_ASM_000847 /LENGTH=45 /DNA_ID= /DNA_START= /DNA_END= /DNA_ORIENTATION=